MTLNYKMYRHDHKNLVAYFTRRWPRLGDYYASDFASYCFLQWAEGKRQETNLKLMAIDYLRTHGPHPSKKGSKDAMTRTVVSDAPEKGIPPETTREEFDLKILDTVQFPHLWYRVLLVLYFKWGFSDEEIGHCFGKSGIWAKEARIGAMNLLKDSIGALRFQVQEDGFDWILDETNTPIARI